MPPLERRRAEDIYRAIEDDVFPRLEKIDEKIASTEDAIHNLQLKGCARREGDLLRTKALEYTIGRIFEKVDGFGDRLATHHVAVTEQIGEINTDMANKIGGVRIWVLTSCVVGLVAILSLFTSGILEKILK